MTTAPMAARLGETSPSYPVVGNDAVVGSDGPVLVANAGGGGWSPALLVHRVKRLLEAGVPGGAILVLAANRRPADLIAGLAAEHPEAGRVATRTVLGFLLQVVREHHLLARLPANFAVLPDDEVLRHLGRYAEDVRFARRGEGYSHGANLQDLVERLTLRPELSLEAVVRTRYPGYLGHEAALHEIRRHYTAMKRAAGCVDEVDILALAIALLGEPTVHEPLRRRYEHVVVDVGQSLSGHGLDALALLAGPRGNLFVAADDAQRLETFRFDRAETVEEFRRRFPCGRVFGANTPLRRPEPLAAFINGLGGRSVAEAALAGEVVPTGPAHRKPREEAMRPVLHVSADDGRQASLLTAEVRRLAGAGFPVERQVVLSLMPSHTFGVQAALRREGLTFRAFGQRGSDRCAHVHDLLAHLHVLSNFRQAWAWTRSLQLAGRIGDKAAARLATAGTRASSLELALAAVVDAAAREMPKFRRHVAALTAALTRAARAPSSGQQYDAVLAYLEPLVVRHYKDRLQERLEELDALRPVAAGHATLVDFLDSFVADPPPLAVRLSGLSTTAVPEVMRGPIEIRSISGSRGREWDVVHVVLPSEDCLPHAVEADGDTEALALARRRLLVAATRTKRYLAMYVVRPPTGGGIAIGERFKPLLNVKDACKPPVVKWVRPAQHG